MLEREVTITNKTGLHARPAARFVKEAGKYKSTVAVIKNASALMSRALSVC